jgi:tetratricopeptide (TPR) repeat protein
MRILLITFILVLSASASFSDTVILKNGRKIQVESMRLEGNVVVCQIGGGEIRFKISEIADVKQSQRKSISTKSQAVSQKKSEKMPKAREIALEAFWFLSDNPFSTVARQKGLAILETARELDPDESEIFLVEAWMTLQDGYKVGSWYKARAFREGTVERAIPFVKKAIDADPEYYKPYTILAFFKIIQTDLQAAEELLEKSSTINNENFYYWFYMGTLSQVRKEYTEAMQYFDTAQNYATQNVMFNLIRTRKGDIAKATGNKLEEERLYLETIANEPDSAHAYGNFAGFLLCNGRFDEAIEYYEQAISISPYPLAIAGLQIARMRNEEGAKCKNNQLQI